MKTEEKVPKMDKKATEKNAKPMVIEMLKLSDLKPYENNPRVNDEAAVELQKSIKAFGFRIPMVITADNVIVCGHTRYKAAQALGLEEVPCIRCEGMTEEQIRAFRIADNKYGELSSWDKDLLKDELEVLKGLDFDVDCLGFTQDELSELTSWPGDSGASESILDNFDFSSLTESAKEREVKSKTATCPECGHVFELK